MLEGTNYSSPNQRNHNIVKMIYMHNQPICSYYWYVLTLLSQCSKLVLDHTKKRANLFKLFYSFSANMWSRQDFHWTWAFESGTKNSKNNVYIFSYKIKNGLSSSFMDRFWKFKALQKALEEVNLVICMWQPTISFGIAFTIQNKTWRGHPRHIPQIYGSKTWNNNVQHSHNVVTTLNC